MPRKISSSLPGQDIMLYTLTNAFDPFCNHKVFEVQLFEILAFKVLTHLQLLVYDVVHNPSVQSLAYLHHDNYCNLPYSTLYVRLESSEAVGFSMSIANRPLFSRMSVRAPENCVIIKILNYLFLLLP